MNPTLPNHPRLIRWITPLVVFVALLLALATLNSSPAPELTADQSAGSAATADAGESRAQLIELRSALAADPADAEGWTSLGNGYYQRARQTGDPTFYARADDALTRALAAGPDPATRATAITGQATVALARHDFAGGLELARQARTIAPALVAPLPAMFDGQVELGRYDAAARTLERMIGLKPTLAAYARVSYFRELNGDLPGALEAMRLAVSAGSGSVSDQTYVQNLMGDLQADLGRYAAAERSYRTALAASPGDATARTALATLAANRGDLDAAIRRLRKLGATAAVPEFTIPLAEAEEAAGLTSIARRDYVLASMQIRLHGARGENVDTELALFEAEHGSASEAVALARTGWQAAPGVRAADALAWALHETGRTDAASRWSAEAMKLGSRDPMFLYHAGMIARADGREAEARVLLGDLLAQSPRFSALYAPKAERALAGLTS